MSETYPSEKQVFRNSYDLETESLKVLLNKNTEVHQELIGELRANNEILLRIEFLLKAIGE